jgi:hypothetical protein
MKHSRKNTGVHRNKTFKGGKTFSARKPVQLHYNGIEVPCDVCGQNLYKENTGTIGKSKMRALMGQFIFGSLADALDNTSIILYSCETCGMCRLVKNSGSRKIDAK